ncbi:hypothetical protein BT96DRAFT_1009490 [Gymnopus androsaceus JB14]|uniref:Uncharacterized protein n=1 Tax=Gymnopus androsaceus JB14 TaxID=1447944 RepID=A0A6A4GCS0_9AGAR|nr:hypothetical protein BT96DRAFT_1009490 [Gymnopus androsaceus JB14]
MAEVCHRRGNMQGQDFWQKVLAYTLRLGAGGMSDEDEGIESVVRGSRTKSEKVKIVKRLPFRHPYFEKLYDVVDQTPGLEELIFNQTGKRPLVRVRNRNSLSMCKPVTRLPRSFFPDGYLGQLFPFELDALQVSEEPWPLYEWTYNGVSYRAADHMNTTI